MVMMTHAILICFFAVGAVAGHSSVLFSVDRYGAKGDGKTDDTQAFTAAWNGACGYAGGFRRPKMLVPKRNYSIGPVAFNGPCKAKSVAVVVKGHVKASTDPQRYADVDQWILFGWLKNLVVAGGGTFDGQGSSDWPHDSCPTNFNCKVLPTSLKFAYTNNTVVKWIQSVNSKFFHFALLGNNNFLAHNLKIMAPENSPNTDGLHMESSNGVTILDSVIGTGDDCISVGPGSTNVLIKNIKCGPGHGISVGSLGRYPNEGNVDGLVVRDRTLWRTMNGLRIKTWQGSPSSTTARRITFENITMKDVSNPIIIDQAYCPYEKCPQTTPSRVKISNVKFNKVMGTSATETAVTLKCSAGFPCKGLRMKDVNLNFKGGKPKAACQNVEAIYSGIQKPLPCKSTKGVTKGSNTIRWHSNFMRQKP